uniref:Uncharacterized protein n=1 Tax=Trichuris muris TaxID=70415 RepID=A0A5S6QJ22_TRIMR
MVGNCLLAEGSSRMRLVQIFLSRHKNAVDQYRFWQVEKTPGPSRSKQTGKRKVIVPVRPNHLRLLQTQLTVENNVMRCLASPYLTKEQEQFWQKSHGTAEEEKAKARIEEEEARMPGKPKFVVGITRVDEVRGNIGNLLHSPRTLEQHFAHLTQENQFE